MNFSVTFDKDKMHDLFYKKGILYSEILDKDLYVLPVLIKKMKFTYLIIIIFTKIGIEIYNINLIEFILISVRKY